MTRNPADAGEIRVSAVGSADPRRSPIGFKIGEAIRHESLLLSGLGGIAGGALRSARTAAYAIAADLPPAISLWAVAGGLLATLIKRELAYANFSFFANLGNDFTLA